MCEVMLKHEDSGHSTRRKMFCKLPPEAERGIYCPLARLGEVLPRCTPWHIISYSFPVVVGGWAFYWFINDGAAGHGDAFGLPGIFDVSAFLWVIFSKCYFVYI